MTIGVYMPSIRELSSPRSMVSMISMVVQHGYGGRGYQFRDVNSKLIWIYNESIGYKCLLLPNPNPNPKVQ